jgi:site-specific DNA-methyltransferase (adenine-specific)
MTNEVHLMDCMDLMRGYPDGYFELACVDVPYGIKMHGGVTYQRLSRPNSYGKKPKHEKKDWDSNRPDVTYFDELFRVSKNQIIWGANYLTEYLPPSMGWIYWGKMEDDSDFSDGELAFTSFERALKSYKCHQFDGTRGGKDRIHPTQKPVKLYDWIFANYAKEGDKILDTHVGSGSSRIAAHRAGLDFIGAELDPDYFAAQEKRYKEFKSQLTLF